MVDIGCLINICELKTFYPTRPNQLSTQSNLLKVLSYIIVHLQDSPSTNQDSEETCSFFSILPYTIVGASFEISIHFYYMHTYSRSVWLVHCKVFPTLTCFYCSSHHPRIYFWARLSSSLRSWFVSVLGTSCLSQCKLIKPKANTIYSYQSTFFNHLFASLNRFFN